ncbi:hypothetical protein OUZ56_029326 [Daphnia magna]|uniref:Uncharacterized protein n=1 Tax=Daphnia magna TaxID=35525 RepID=A0ABR0B6I3_9CRUS|nr:hypothetical protein OUZ56_029326 [Daphnia magna]
MAHISSFKGRNHFPLSKLKTILQPTPSMRAWSEKLILHKSEKEHHFTGSVWIVGPVQLVESFRSDWINGINVSVLSGVLVDKNAHQIGIKDLSISLVLCLLTMLKWIL